VLIMIARSDLATHPDRLRWNARYESGFTPSFRPHPLAERALALTLPDGPVLDLASGPSGSALLAAAAGRGCVAVDASDVALGLLEHEAASRGLSGLISLVHADLGSWRPEPASYAVVLCTGFWDRALLPGAAEAVLAGGRTAVNDHAAAAVPWVSDSDGAGLLERLEDVGVVGASPN